MVWCDFCGSRQAILYCRADSAKLCLWCDQQVHSANSLSKKHLRSQICDNCDRCPVDSFSGCPSALELAAEIEKPYGLLDDLMVSNKKKKNWSCGKQKQVILKQLIELLADVRPGTPQELAQDRGGFTSLLMMPTPACDHGAQIWDFNLGQLRGREESSPVELEFGESDMYTMKSYKEASLAKRRVVGVSGVNCSVAKEDIIPFHNAANNQTPSHGPATSERNNVPVSRPPCSGLTKPESLGGSKDLQFTNQSILLASESVAAMSKSNIELLAMNRGNAMQRYKEKKKTRRYDKHIRYESRKARADTRKRVKGRFVKAHEALA